MKTINIPGVGPLTLPACYGLPTVAGLVIAGAMWLTIWSYNTPPVRFTKVTVEQMGPGDTYITLKITKFVNWARLCPGIAEQEIRALVAVDNPAKVSGSPVKLDSHVINTPRRLGPNGQPGDPVPERFIVVPAGALAMGKWQYKVTAKISCMPWEYLWPIESHSAIAEFTIK